MRDAADPRPQGVALAGYLLTDTVGPLYNHEAHESIEHVACLAAAALERQMPALNL